MQQVNIQGCIAVEDHESSLKDIFGANLSNEEILQKALQTILDIANHMNCSERVPMHAQQRQRKRHLRDGCH